MDMNKKSLSNSRIGSIDCTVTKAETCSEVECLKSSDSRSCSYELTVIHEMLWCLAVKSLANQDIKLGREFLAIVDSGSDVSVEMY